LSSSNAKSAEILVNQGFQRFFYFFDPGMTKNSQKFEQKYSFWNFKFLGVERFFGDFIKLK